MPMGTASRTTGSTSQEGRTPMLIGSAIAFVDAISMGILLPVLPFIALHFGASPALVTQLVAVMGLAVLVGGPFIGVLGDRFGRVPILRLTLVGSVLTQLGMLLSWSISGLFLFRGLGGVLAARSGLVRAWATDAAPAGDHAGRIGWLATAGNFGAIFGPLIGGMLALFFHSEEAHYQAVLLLAAALSALMLGVTLIFVRTPSPAAARRDTRTAPLKGQPNFGPLMAPFLLVGLSAYAYGVLVSVTALFVHQQFGWGALETGQLLSFAAFITAMSRIVAFPRAIARFGELGALCVAILVGAPALVLMGFAQSPAAYLAAFGAYFVSASIITVIPTAMLSVKSAPAHRGQVMGWAQGLSAAATGASASLNGLLFGYVSPSAPYVAGGLALSTGLVVALALRSKAAQARRSKMA